MSSFHLESADFTDPEIFKVYVHRATEKADPILRRPSVGLGQGFHAALSSALGVLGGEQVSAERCHLSLFPSRPCLRHHQLVSLSGTFCSQEHHWPSACISGAEASA